MTTIDNSTVISYFKKIKDITEKINQLPASKHKNYLQQIINNMSKIYKEYSKYLKTSLKDEFRYIDYFSYDLSGEELIEYFNKNYVNEDIDDRIIDYTMFCFIKYVSEIIEIYEEFELSELCYLVDANNFFEKLIYLSSFLTENLEKSKWNPETKSIELPFVENAKYEIFFAGFSLDDIKKLEPNVKIQLINKLTNPLATETVIPKLKTIAHVKDDYDFSIQRIQFADDYRIAFIRFENTTVILGVSLKTGKDLDYTRYDAIAKNKKQLYEEIRKFISGENPITDDHHKVIDILHKAFVKKKNNQKK